MKESFPQPQPIPNPKHARLFTPEELARLHSQMPEEMRPSVRRPKQERTARAETPILHKLLSEEINYLKSALQEKTNYLASLNRSSLSRTHYKGEVVFQPDPNDIIDATDAIIGLKIQLESLEETLYALKNNKPPPADFRATLKAIKKQLNQNPAVNIEHRARIEQIIQTI